MKFEEKEDIIFYALDNLLDFYPEDLAYKTAICHGEVKEVGNVYKKIDDRWIFDGFRAWCFSNNNNG